MFVVNIEMKNNLPSFFTDIFLVTFVAILLENYFTRSIHSKAFMYSLIVVTRSSIFYNLLTYALLIIVFFRSSLRLT